MKKQEHTLSCSICSTNILPDTPIYITIREEHRVCYHCFLSDLKANITPQDIANLSKKNIYGISTYEDLVGYIKQQSDQWCPVCFKELICTREPKSTYCSLECSLVPTKESKRRHMTPIMKVCAGCSQEFPSYTKFAKYCTEACAKATYRARVREKKRREAVLKPRKKRVIQACQRIVL